MSEQTINCDGACTVTVVHEIALPVLNLSTADASAITGAVLVIWAIGWAFRALIRTLKNTDGFNNSED